MELLAVVAIIVVLVALLLPVVQKIRLSAANARCVSNLRILGGAYNAYRAEHNGNGPPHQVDSRTYKYLPYDEGHSYPGIHSLRCYYREGPRYVVNEGNTAWIRDPTEWCPAGRLTGLAGRPNHSMAENVLATDYTMTVGNNYVDADGVTMPGQALLNNVANLSKIPIIWDSWGGEIGWTLPLRHFNGINAAFLDGHVEHVSQSLEDGRLYVTWWQQATMYRNPADIVLGKGAPMGRTTKE